MLKAFVEAHVPRNLPTDQGLEWAGARAIDQAIHGPRDVYWAHRR